MAWLKRFFRHVWMSPIILRNRFPKATLDAIERAVGESEQQHRGQVRFAIEAELTTAELWQGLTSRQRALQVFSHLGVWDTAENNGVLIYVLLADHRVEIVADRGIHQHVGNERWSAICKEIELHYRRGDFQAGSVSGVEKITAELAHYFPRRGEQKNEQGDGVVVL